jgi:ATP/maltotriose-dependent transcriptional regulator MalT/DNA-binding SARP family transcriptional activator
MQPLSSKIYQPTRQPKTLRRIRLLDLLHSNIHRKVTYVCAPAGYGKTTLLVDFVEDVDADVYWFRITSEDIDFSTFIENIVNSFQVKNADFGLEILASVAAGQNSPATIASLLAGELSNELLDFSLLVLDDFHEVSQNPTITDFLEVFIGALPDQLRILIGSRTVYGIPTALLYVQEQLTIISETDLKFHPEEISELCRRYYKLVLTKEQLRRISEQAEGWIVAILLALRSNNLSISIPKIVGARDHVFNYLADEVFQSVSEPLKVFMQATSVVDEFNIPLANHLARISSAEEMIKQINELNLFLTHSERDENQIYRYHQLFSEFLHRNLQENHPEDLLLIHHRAADWYQEHHYPIKATKHYHEAKKDAMAAKIMNEAATELYLSGQVIALEEWHQWIIHDADLLVLVPNLLLNLAKISINQGDYDTAEQLLAQAETEFIKKNDHDHYVNLLVTRGMLMRFRGDYPAVLDLADRVQTLVHTHRLDDYYWFQAERLIGISKHYLEDSESALVRLSSAAHEFRKNLEKDFNTRQAHELIMTLADIGYIALAIGKILEAQKSYREAFDLSKKMRVNSTDVVVAANNYAYLHFLLGNYSEAWQYYLYALEVVKSNDLNQFLTYIMNGQADVLREIDEFSEARKIYLDVIRLAEEHENVGSQGVAYAGLVSTEAYEEDFNQAMFYLRERIRVKGGGTEDSDYQAGLGWVYLKMGQSEMAQKSLAAAIKNEGENKAPSQDQVYLYYHYALALNTNGDEKTALEFLNKALGITAALGYDQFFVNEVRRNYPASKQLGASLESQQFSSILQRSQLPSPSMKDLILPEPEAITERYSIHVSSLNEGAVYINGRRISPRAWSSVGAKALFYFIVDQKRVRKSEIALEFWPDFSTGKVNSNFHATLWRVRKGLEIKNLIAFVDDYYQINPEVDLIYDVDEFEQVLGKINKSEIDSPERRAYSRQALEIYHNDFLPEIDMGWADERRRELQNSFLRILVDLGEMTYTRKNYSEALEIFQRAIEIEPFRDDIHLWVLRCLVGMGDFQLAKKHYHEYTFTLQKELGLSPSEELTQLIDNLG